MRTFAAAVALVALVALSGCGGSDHLTQAQVCRQWDHLLAHPGKDPIGATNDLLQRTRPASRIMEALLRLAQDDNYNMTHQHARDTETDMLRVQRICAGVLS